MHSLEGRERKVQGASAWLVLRSDLERWIGRRFGPSVDAGNVASEAMLIAMHNCPYCPVLAPKVVWAWMRSTAVHRIADSRRGSKRHTVEIHANLDAWVSKVNGAGSRSSADLVVALRETARGASSSVLRLLESGMSRNADMARALGVSVRAVERARQRLRALALALRQRRNSGSVSDDFNLKFQRA